MLLVADDDDDLLEEATHWLGQAGYQVRVARHGGEAINALQGGMQPSVIILDLMMPVTSGWDVWDWLQASASRDLPVIIWTATGLSQGAVGHARVVQKGRDPQTLLKAIRELLGTAGEQTPAFGVGAVSVGEVGAAPVGAVGAVSIGAVGAVPVGAAPIGAVAAVAAGDPVSGDPVSGDPDSGDPVSGDGPQKV